MTMLRDVCRLWKVFLHGGCLGVDAAGGRVPHRAEGQGNANLHCQLAVHLDRTSQMPLMTASQHALMLSTKLPPMAPKGPGPVWSSTTVSGLAELDQPAYTVLLEFDAALHIFQCSAEFCISSCVSVPQQLLCPEKWFLCYLCLQSPHLHTFCTSLYSQPLDIHIV